MSIYSRAAGIFSQVNEWAKMGNVINVAVKRALIASPLASLGIAFVAGVDTVASGIFGVIDEMFAIGASFFASFGSIIGIIPAGATTTQQALEGFGILAVLLGLAIVIAAFYMLNWARDNLWDGAELPVSGASIPFIEDEDDDQGD